LFISLLEYNDPSSENGNNNLGYLTCGNFNYRHGPDNAFRKWIFVGDNKTGKLYYYIL
jgi:hypothetical protein